MAKKKTYKKIYAFYHRDTFICMGTIPEICRYTGKPKNTIWVYGNERYKNGNSYVLIEVEDDEEDEIIEDQGD